MPIDPGISNVMTKYFQLQGVRFDIKDPVHQELFRRNLRTAQVILRMSTNNISVAYKKMEEVADWANENELEWTLETVAKRWLSNNSITPKRVYKEFKPEPLDKIDRSRMSDGLKGLREIMKGIKK